MGTPLHRSAKLTGKSNWFRKPTAEDSEGDDLSVQSSQLTRGRTGAENTGRKEDLEVKAGPDVVKEKEQLRVTGVILVEPLR